MRANGSNLETDSGNVVATFPHHWGACAAMIQISDPSFRSLGKATPFELGWVAGLVGEDPRLCPYEQCTAEWREWQSFHGKATEFRAEEIAAKALHAGAENHRKIDRKIRRGSIMWSNQT